MNNQNISGEIYLLITREFIKTNEHIYKIGYTQQENGAIDRLKQYPKSSKLLYHQYVFEDVKQIEKKIKLCFDNKFIKRKDIGAEYYEGDLIFMILELLPIVNNNTIEMNNNFKIKKTDPLFLDKNLWKTKLTLEELYIQTPNPPEWLIHIIKSNDTPEKQRSALIEACEYNIFREYGILDKINTYDTYSGKKDKLFKKARYNIFKYIIEMLKHDPINGDYPDVENNLIKEAGQMLNQEGGFNSMKDNLIWSFIPDRYHSDINLLWNGIGQWVS